MISPTDLQNIIRNGLLSFPVTPFDAQDNFARRRFRPISIGCRSIRSQA